LEFCPEGAKIRIHKFVHFFLLEYLSGDPADHDHEVNEARWVEINQALGMVRFESEKRILRLAKDMILS
jgi:8-oxo-dGTP pyrophosphatase MutT (NUDIX family)